MEKTEKNIKVVHMCQFLILNVFYPLNKVFNLSLDVMAVMIEKTKKEHRA